MGTFLFPVILHYFWIHRRFSLMSYSRGFLTRLCTSALLKSGADCSHTKIFILYRLFKMKVPDGGFRSNAIKLLKEPFFLKNSHCQPLCMPLVSVLWRCLWAFLCCHSNVIGRLHIWPYVYKMQSQTIHIAEK